MGNLTIKIAEVEEKVRIQQGLIENLLGFVTTKYPRAEYMEYLESVISSPHAGEEAKFTATEMLRQDSLWTPEQLSGQKQ